MGTASYYEQAPPTATASGSALLPEQRDSTSSSRSLQNEAPITLGIAVRRARLVVYTAIMLIVIVAIMVFFRHGVALMYFDSREKNATQQTKLLDNYNAYSGNIATIFATPIEMFVTLAVQVVLLRLMADLFTRSDMGWKISALTLALSAGVRYLIGNGFNALNVQLRAQEIQPMILKHDTGHIYSYSWADNLRTTVDSFVPELTDGNLVLNTLLCQVIMPKYMRDPAECSMTAADFASAQNTSNASTPDVEESFVGLGFLQRDWYGRVLQRAPPSDKMRVVVNPTNKTNTPKSSDLPMNASVAAVLFYHGITLGASFFPWGPGHAFANRSDITRRYPVSDSESHVFQDSTAKIYALLPPDEVTEGAQKAWFLRESMAAMSRQFAFAERTKTSDLVMEFSHTQLADTITFDAITFEVEIDPALLATVTSGNNRTRFTVLDQMLSCPIGLPCMIPKQPYRVSEGRFDPPPQVFAFGTCADEDGNEVLRSNFTRQNTTVFDDHLLCAEAPANQSMLIVSIGKRLVADALDQNVSMTSSGATHDPKSATVTNLRKIYSFTVGRLAWEYIDLAKAFHARCGIEDQSLCTGLVVPLMQPLDDNATRTAEQRLVVRYNDAPTRLLTSPVKPPSLTKITLLMLDEPSEVLGASKLYETLAGDLLLPHNVGNSTWDSVNDNVYPGCSADVEDRIIQTIGNHYYMEHSLQGGYTTGLYFLMMYAVVKDVIQVSPSKLSLAFEGNSQSIAVWVSIPSQNMWLTLAGCVLLVGGLFIALIKATWLISKHGDALTHITDPQAIARVMVDERNYPPMFLHRHVIETEGTGSVDNYSIAGLTLRQQQEEGADCVELNK